MKACKRCKQEKSYSEFYVRSGIDSPTTDGHYTSECKQCMKARSKGKPRVKNIVPRYQSETIAIEELAKLGYPALPGKAVSAVDVDVVVWGHVWVEVKYSKLQTSDGVHNFNTTLKQQERGFLAHVVMLICENVDGVRTNHFFKPDDPVFYMNGRLKTGFTFRPGATKALKHGNNRVVMTQPMMDRAAGMRSLIAQEMGHIVHSLCQQS